VYGLILLLLLSSSGSSSSSSSSSSSLVVVGSSGLCVADVTHLKYGKRFSFLRQGANHCYYLA